MSDNKKVLETIRTMLDIANRETTNENEADAALSRVQALLAKHNLSLEDVARSEDEDYVIAKTKLYDSLSFMHVLGSAIAALYFCKYYRGREWAYSRSGNSYLRERHCFAGLSHNAEVALLMFEYLHKTVTKLARKGAHGIPVKGGGYWRFVTSFQAAASQRLGQRMRAKIPTPEQPNVPDAPEGSTGRALVVLYQSEAQKVEDFLNRKIGPLVPGKKQKPKK